MIKEQLTFEEWYNGSGCGFQNMCGLPELEKLKYTFEEATRIAKSGMIEELRCEKTENKDLIERVNELEKEYKDLKALRKYEITVASAEIEKLQAENAELKDTVTKMNNVIIGTFSNLTKAKEILQEYIRINLLPPIERNFDDEVKLFKQAEDFMKESEQWQRKNLMNS